MTKKSERVPGTGVSPWKNKRGVTSRMNKIAFIAFVAFVSIGTIWKCFRGPVYYEEPSIQLAVEDLVKVGSPEAFFVLGYFYKYFAKLLKMKKYHSMSKKFFDEACKDQEMKKVVEDVQNLTNDQTFSIPNRISDLDSPMARFVALIADPSINKDSGMIKKLRAGKFKPALVWECGLESDELEILAGTGYDFANRLLLIGGFSNARSHLRKLDQAGSYWATEELAKNYILFWPEKARIYLEKLDRAGSDWARDTLKRYNLLREPDSFARRVLDRIWSAIF